LVSRTTAGLPAESTMALETSSCVVVFDAAAATAVTRKDAPPRDDALAAAAVTPTGPSKKSVRVPSIGDTRSEREPTARHDEMVRVSAKAISTNAKGRNR
jgi:hypothetical protein